MKKLIMIALLGTLVLGLTPALAQTYPQLDIDGFKKWEYKKAEVDPSRNYFAGLTHLGGYYPTFTGSPWQERLQLRILGQLSEDLSVTYDLEQQPEIPDRYDVKVKYYNNELTFGDFTASFSGNEFATTSKFLNGVMLTAKDSWYDVLTVPSAKLKSQTQNLTSQLGNNTKGPYSLGHGSIVEGSERVELNGVLLTRNVDYTIDYFEGQVSFNQILADTDEFKYSYEYTNILDLFFPSLSKRDFFGFQSRLTIDPEEFGKPAPKEKPLIESARERFPSQGELEPEIMEAEASGQFRLKHVPLVRFSERLTFMGTELKKNEDYIIRYDQGEIKLLTRFLPSAEQALEVEYKHYIASEEVENIAGIGSRGPYRLAHSMIVPESERIEVDGKLVVRDLDYTINYEAGEIVFGVVIGQTSQVKAKYLYSIMVTPTIPPSKFPKELKVGLTYLRESAKKSVTTATSSQIEGALGQDIINENYHLNLSNRPIVPTEEGATFIVKVDDVELTPEVHYVIPTTHEATLPYINDPADPTDGYATGTILFLDHTSITATSQVTVTYTSYKSVVGKYSGVGSGMRGPYYLTNIRNIIPGTEIVQVWDQGSSVITTYTRNSSFEPDAGDLGYAINYNENNPSITFNKELATTSNFQVIFQYVPPQAFAGGDIAQSVAGLDGSFKIGEIFKIDAAYAKSETDQVFAAVPSSEIFAGDGNKTYSLSSAQEIIEGSEKVYVNGYLRNKDIDYYISYAAPGQITFYYITPTSSDAIRVDYDFKEAGGTTVDIKEDIAYRLGAETTLFDDKLTVGGNTKRIGSDFTPMGGTSIGLGSKYKEYYVKLNPDYHSLTTNYSYKENNSPIGAASDNRFLKSFDNSFDMSINPNDAIQVQGSYRNYRTIDDLLPSATSHNSDTLQESYALSLLPADWQQDVWTFSHKYDIKKTFSQSDTERDSGNFSETNSDYLHTNLGLKFTERVTLGFDYQQNEPKTSTQKTATEEASLSSHERSVDTSYDLSIDLTPGFLEKWTARVSLLDHKKDTLAKDFNVTREAQATKNETYHMDLVPISQINSSLDHNRQEQSSVVVGGINPRSERTSGNIRYTPYTWLTAGYSGSQSESVPESGVNFRTTGRSNSYTASWNPISYNYFKLSSNFAVSDNDQTAPSGSDEAVTTKTNSFSQNYTINLLPHPNAPVTLGYALENYSNMNNHSDPASQIDTETVNTTLSGGINLTPLPVLNISSNYSQKITSVEKDLDPAKQGEEKTKTVWDNKVTYQVASWGTFVYERQEEKNGGEIQAGSVADINIEKTSQSFNLNIKLPMDNPVLSSFDLIASLKMVDYKNLDNGDDNFNAQLWTIEGSLNF